MMGSKKDVSPVSIFSAAKRLGETSNWNITNLAMQKLSYIAHMYHIGELERPLVKGNFEAWIYGPVYPALYHELKQYREKIIPAAALQSFPSIPEGHSGLKYLDAAVTELSSYNLIRITHWEGGAWYKNYDRHVRGIVIHNNDILDEYHMRSNLASEK